MVFDCTELTRKRLKTITPFLITSFSPEVIASGENDVIRKGVIVFSLFLVSSVQSKTMMPGNSRKIHRCLSGKDRIKASFERSMVEIQLKLLTKSRV